MRMAVLGLVILAALLAGAQGVPADGKVGDQASAGEAQRGIERALRSMREGLEGQDQRQFFSAFDGKTMKGFLEFRDSVAALLGQYDPIRLRYQIVQVGGDGERATATVELQMDATPRNGAGAELRRDRQLRFVFENGKKGWKIVDVSPPEFFAVTGG